MKKSAASSIAAIPWLLLLLLANLSFAQNVQFDVTWNGKYFDFTLQSPGGLLNGELGKLIPEELGAPDAFDCGQGNICYQWGSLLTLNISQKSDGNCRQIQWTTSQLRRLQDCYLLEDAHWYGGGELFTQRWPIETQSRPEVAFVTGDTIQDGSNNGGCSEPYWLSSKGHAVRSDLDTPLFVSLNASSDERLCLGARIEKPYAEQDLVRLSYAICGASDVKQAHLLAVEQFWAKPSQLPDEVMLRYPIWSTWARYRESINQTKVMDFAAEIQQYGFNASQIEIDDRWESCYGEFSFDAEKFPQPASMVDTLHDSGFRVTLWIHPFVNIDCPIFSTADSFLVRDSKNVVALTKWWQGSKSGIYDFTSTLARTWWSNRVQKIKTTFGIDSFKFDAGETNWLPVAYNFPNEDAATRPNIFSKRYAENMVQFGGMVEVRTAYAAQNIPIFVRMLDKDSRWGYNNGLKSLIPSLLQFNIIGYPFVLPDMIGGNGYNVIGVPERELYIRWMQVNVFMPTMQFSFVPWDYDQEVIDIATKMTDLHAQYADTIIDAARDSVDYGWPLHRPVWWIAPTDSETWNIDSQFLVGSAIMVAPIVEQGAVKRDIYLPFGFWSDGNDPSVRFQGPTWIRDYPAPLDTLPFFIHNMAYEKNELK